MCGITGYVGDSDGLPIIAESLKNLEYRGYDSAGVALENGALEVYKHAGEIDDLEGPATSNAHCGVGHTRWSTHGEPTDANAHPHTDCTDRVAVVHNGIIENYDELRTELSETHTFTSETDTEVVPHLIEDELTDDGDLLAGTEATLDLSLEAVYSALAYFYAHPDEMRAGRRAEEAAQEEVAGRTLKPPKSAE